MANLLIRHWYKKSLSWLTIMLLPLSWIFRIIINVRRSLYASHILEAHRFNVPVIVVGNITLGGTGKTPFVIWLANWLLRHGYKNPGIVSRGVGAANYDHPMLVKPDSSTMDVGDEALLLANKTSSPVVIYPRRVKAIQYLLAQHDCDVVICDDGLQHYQLAREMEIVIIDGQRRFGNQQLLPAGPLREPMSRLRTVNFSVVNGGDEADEFSFSVIPTTLVNVHDNHVANINELKGKKVHAVAGIGNPERFFELLEQLGMVVIRHAFPDHYAFKQTDIEFVDNHPIIMTAKDAVKCKEFSLSNSWYLDIAIEPNDKFQKALLCGIEKFSKKEMNYAV